MQGVPYINSAKFWYAKLLWTILLICCTAGMTLHLYYLINQFLQWPIQTKIELGFSNLNFPAVTICNVNPIRNSKVYMASEHLQSLLAQLETTSLYGDANAEVCLHLLWVYTRSNHHCTSLTELSWSWSYGSWIYRYPCNQCLSPTGTCFIQKIYAPSSSLLQGKHLPFSPSPLRLNIFLLFVILSLTQLYRYTPEIFLFSTATFK